MACCYRFSPVDVSLNPTAEQAVSGTLQRSKNQLLACASEKSPLVGREKLSPAQPSTEQSACRGPNGKSVNHSNRRISTGSKRAAARAGTSVARTEIPIATTEIQTPSIALG